MKVTSNIGHRSKCGIVNKLVSFQLQRDTTNVQELINEDVVFKPLQTKPLKMNFPHKLWTLTNHTYSRHSGISWTLNGTAIAIDEQLFEKYLISSTLFKTNVFSSFVRQMNMYKFCKLPNRTNNSLVHIYHHPAFIRGRRYLLPRIIRPLQETYIRKITSKCKSARKKVPAPRIIFSRTRMDDKLLDMVFESVLSDFEQDRINESMLIGSKKVNN